MYPWSTGNLTFSFVLVFWHQRKSADLETGFLQAKRSIPAGMEKTGFFFSVNLEEPLSFSFFAPAVELFGDRLQLGSDPDRLF
jgi:hypothetical protein